MKNIALHPSERAALRAARRPQTRQAWRRAALITAALALAILACAVAARSFLPSWTPSSASTTSAAAVPPAIGSPGSGTTGTAELPPEPIGQRSQWSADVGITPALPFSMRSASAIDRGRALECLTAAIYYEAASEPDDGQRAVAQVVLNRVRHPAFPATVCGVIYQGSDRASGCQFSYACDGSMARQPSRADWARATRNAATALSGYVFRPVGLATHYHTYAVTPAWNRTLVMTDAIGAHFFHRWKGYWGTSAAFHQRYVGHEPIPGPLPRATPLVPGLSPVIALAHGVPVAPPVNGPANGPVNASAAAEPASRDGVAVPAAANPPPLITPDSQILDRWKDSGKPLR